MLQNEDKEMNEAINKLGQEQRKVAIVMGSKSDYEIMKNAEDVLRMFNVPHSVKILSAHRTPDSTATFAKTAQSNGYFVIIAGAGMSAHLAGAIAAHTIVPVLGVPLPGGILDGVDSLLSTVNMPKGIPVLTSGIGISGAINAALSAVQIFAVVGNNAKLFTDLKKYREDQAESVQNDNYNFTKEYFK
jgi:5-(carboxyamino)imidazole ribonucleotide mutase